MFVLITHCLGMLAVHDNVLRGSFMKFMANSDCDRVFATGPMKGLQRQSGESSDVGLFCHVLAYPTMAMDPSECHHWPSIVAGHYRLSVRINTHGHQPLFTNATRYN